MKTKKKKTYPLLWLFFGFLLVMTIADLCVPFRSFSDMENRYLAGAPKFSLAALFDGSYTRKYETYVSDQFVGRDSWITAKSHSESALLKTENNGIVYGKDGRLFEKYTSYDEGQLERNLDFIAQFANKQGNVTFSVVPSGYVLMPDALPYGLTLADQETALLNIEKSLSENIFNGAVRWIDTLGLLRASGEDDLYYRTDHHWRVRGAYLFYKEFCTEKGFVPVPAESLPLREVEGFYGTYFSKCKRAGTPPDTLTFYDIPVDSVTVDGVEKGGWYDETLFEKRDKYGALLYGNGGLTVLKNEDGPRKLLLIKDSYSNALAPLFLENYDAVYVVDLRSFPKGLEELCRSENFTDTLILYSFQNLAMDTNLYRITL